MSNNLFGPSSIIDCMIGLHTGNDFLRNKSRYVIRMNVLGVFYAKPSVPFTIFFRYPVKNIQQGMDSFISNGMDHNLKTCTISRFNLPV